MRIRVKLGCSKLVCFLGLFTRYLRWFFPLELLIKEEKIDELKVRIYELQKELKTATEKVSLDSRKEGMTKEGVGQSGTAGGWYVWENM